MNLFVGAVTTGLILALLGLGVFLSYRIFHALDLTADGSFGMGAAIIAALLIREMPPVMATVLATVAGVGAGSMTGLIHTRFRVTTLLAGVLTSTALYSVSLFIMGSGNVSLVTAETLMTASERAGTRLFGLPPSLAILGATLPTSSVATLVVIAVLTAVLALSLMLFLKTDLGLAMRAAGNNPQMARAIAVDVDRMIVLGLGVSNGLVALAGALFAQFEGFASIQMGIGAVVTGLANLLVGEALVGRRTLGRWIAAAVIGAVIFRLLVAAAIRAGLNPNALKLVTATLVLVVLVAPQLWAQARPSLAWKGVRSRA